MQEGLLKNCKTKGHNMSNVSYRKTPSRDVFQIFSHDSPTPGTLPEWSICLVPVLDHQRVSGLCQASRSIQAPLSHKVQPQSKGQNRTDRPASVLN